MISGMNLKVGENLQCGSKKIKIYSVIKNLTNMGTTAIIAMNNLDAHRAMVIAHRTNDAFATGMLTASIKALKAELAKRIVKITFLKKDGTITTRHATTTPSYAGQFVNGNGYCSDARNVVSFVDIDAVGNKWRSFRYERLISWE